MVISGRVTPRVSGTEEEGTVPVRSVSPEVSREVRKVGDMDTTQMKETGLTGQEE